MNGAKIALINKCDLERKLVLDTSAFDKTLEISAKYTESTEKLTKEIESLFIEGEIDYNSDAIVASARQFAALSRTRDALTAALVALIHGQPADMYTADLRVALSALGEVDGRTVNEEIVNEIFHHFCVGK